MSDDTIKLARDVDATQIPSGTKTILARGTEVIVTQSLGGSHTVATNRGLYRVEEKDNDALGMAIKEVDPAEHAAALAGGVDEKIVWDRLKTVYDPEIPVNIVDLGLVYHMDVTKTEAGTHKVNVKMTLTAPGCGMAPTIQADAKSKVLTVPGVTEAEVELVWEPAWNQNMMSEVGKMKLGMI